MLARRVALSVTMMIWALWPTGVCAFDEAMTTNGSETMTADVSLKTVIMGLKSLRGASPQLCLSLDRAIEGGISHDTQREVMSRADLRQLMQLEAEKAAMGCEGDSCLAEIADALDADRVISGTIDRLGSSYLVVLTELDAREVRVVGRIQRRLSTDEDRLFGAIEKMARDLTQKDANRGVETGSLVVTSMPPAEVFVDGESYGGSPAVIGDLDPGIVELELISGSDKVVIEAPIAYAASTRVDAQIHLTRGPSIDEIKANAQAAFWGGVLSIGELLIGGPLILLSPFCGCGVGLGLAAVTGFGYDSNGNFAPQLSLTFWSTMSAVGIAVFSIAAGLLGLSATTFVFGPDVPDMGAPEHTVTITPPQGEGEPIQLRIDAGTGDTDEIEPPSVDPEITSDSAVKEALGWTLRRRQTVMAH